MYLLPVIQLKKLLVDAESALPREASGLLLGRDFGRFTALSVIATPSHENTIISFRISNSDIDRVEEQLRGSDTRIRGCFHSHVFGAARPSSVDCSATKAPGDLWMIYAARFSNLKLFRWNGTSFQRERFGILPSL